MNNEEEKEKKKEVERERESEKGERERGVWRGLSVNTDALVEADNLGPPSPF